MPGAEQLLVDPEVLRQREGSQANQSLLSFATTLRKLAQGNQPHTINHTGSVLTKLLAGTFPSLPSDKQRIAFFTVSGQPQYSFHCTSQWSQHELRSVTDV